MQQQRSDSCEEKWWDGYHQGIKEASEIWVACIHDAMDGRGGWYREDTSAVINWILELAERELGFTSKPGATATRRVDGDL